MTLHCLLIHKEYVIFKKRLLGYLFRSVQITGQLEIEWNKLTKQ